MRSLLTGDGSRGYIKSSSLYTETLSILPGHDPKICGRLLP